ncbi:hypothetical protein J7373_16740 [Xanthomonas sp. A2111]|uniref:Uncharacterized protein n=1 Tax=Xanthomonas hawaiiensis TaxID=3003247 RepID=A0ABU2I0R3_9XANT|nr:hypothetical protein [Xanthomonas sp. A2111]MBO9829902.1 hypothetical protein [Xanthomonas sp. A2111]MDS9991735.1 hypothetical protein [Xanthomonas sp. A2111]
MFHAPQSIDRAWSRVVVGHNKSAPKIGLASQSIDRLACVAAPSPILSRQKIDAEPAAKNTPRAKQKAPASTAADWG